MASILNADTSNGLKITSDTSGEIKLQSAGTDIATVDSSGITMASGKNLVTTAPAFEAYMSANQSVSATTFTKVAFDAVVFDTASAFDTANNRFQPNVEGYYQINTGVYLGDSRVIIRLYKNGATFKYGIDVDTVSGQQRIAHSAWFVYMNGTTDYLEINAWKQNAGNILGGNTQYSLFSGFLARAV